MKWRACSRPEGKPDTPSCYAMTTAPRKTGWYTDKAVTSEQRPRHRESRQALRDGLADRKAEAYRDHESPARWLTIWRDWQANLIAQGFTPKHAEHTSNRVRRLVAVMLGSQAALIDHRKLAPKDRGDVARKTADAIAPARLSSLTREKVQDAIARFQAAGWSLQTCNHYRAGVKAFVEMVLRCPSTSGKTSCAA